MIRSTIAALAALCLTLIVQSADAAASAAPAAPASKPSPDLRPFEIPSVSMATEGFGKQLELACQNAKMYEPAKKAVQDLGKAAVAKVAPIASAKEVDDAVSNADAAELDKIAKAIAVLCDSLEKSTITAPQLDELRALLASGDLPAIAAALAGNPSDRADLAAKVKVETGKPQGDAPVGTSAVSGLESMVLNGLADFLVSRTKEEAILYLQDRLGNELCKQQGLDKIFPNTCSLVSSIDYSLSLAAMGTALNAAAKADLRALPDAMLKVGEEKSPDKFYAYEALRLVYAMALTIDGGRSPLEVAESLHGLAARSCEEQKSPNAANTSCQGIFRSMRLVSGLLYTIQSNSIHRENLLELPKKPVLVVGTLLDAENRGNSNTPALDAWKLKAAEIRVLTQAMATAAQVVKEWKSRIDPLTKGLENNTTAADRRRQLAAVAVDVTKQLAVLIRSYSVYFVSDPGDRQAVTTAMSLVASTSELVKHLLQEQYGPALLDGRNLVASLDVLRPPAEVKRVMDDAQRILPLISEIASAKSSADVSGALQAAAAPAGSYRAKYQRPVVAIGALVGAFGGWERPNTPNNESALGSAKSSGVIAGFAPVGFQASTALCKSAYLGVMLSVVDLGALTTTRFESEVTDEKKASSSTNVSFGQVFSPGIYGLVGIGGSPIVAGIGASFAPSLRTVEATTPDGTIKQDLSTLRAGILLGMDLTILPL